MKIGRNQRSRGSLPWVIVNVAMTADGKIAPANGKYEPFGSRRDHDHLLELRATADAVMCGARTADAFPVNLGPGPAKYRRMRKRRGLAEYNLRVVVSGSGSINPKAEVFRHRFSPIIVLTTESVPAARQRRLGKVADAVKGFGEREVDFLTALQWLRKEWNIKRLICEGGGELNAALFRAGLVNEMYLTICPVVFGGRNAPTLAGGEGVNNLIDSAKLKLVSMTRAGAEVFLRFTG